MTFRSRPESIEPAQFFPDRRPWPGPVLAHPPPLMGRPMLREFYVVGPDGRNVAVAAGDWVIPEPGGRARVCPPGEFGRRYERAEVVK